MVSLFVDFMWFVGLEVGLIESSKTGTDLDGSIAGIIDAFSRSSGFEDVPKEIRWGTMLDDLLYVASGLARYRYIPKTMLHDSHRQPHEPRNTSSVSLRCPDVQTGPPGPGL
jgi:hypothetical protein